MNDPGVHGRLLKAPTALRSLGQEEKMTRNVASVLSHAAFCSKLKKTFSELNKAHRNERI